MNRRSVLDYLENGVSQAKERARAFVEGEKAFRLGDLLTESFHPKTRELSQTMERDIAAGLRLLQSVDDDIPLALGRIFAQESFGRLVEALREAMLAGHRIFFTGCGATGRLSILLEAAWREFCRKAGPGDPEAANADHASLRQGQGRLSHDKPGRAGTGTPIAMHRDWEPTLTLREDLCFSVMAGGDFALIKSVEGFEDFPDFGRRQLREAGVQQGDVVVAITEGGETPFVIGTAWQGLDARAKVFFVYNNPTDLLCRHVQRSREVIDEPRIQKLDLATGPMAITGSTRMQATTTELLVVGAALEMALAGCAAHAGSADRTKSDESVGHAYASVSMVPGADHVGREKSWWAEPTLREAGRSTRQYQQLFEQLLSQLSAPDAVDAMARLVRFEESLYRQHGLVTYVADSVLLDVLTDTTERAPTFMLPPFRKSGDAVSPVSWVFVKNPHLSSEEAWREMLQREPRGLTWGPQVYRQLNAPQAIGANPPKLDNDEIYRFQIGNEPDPSRTNAPDSALVFIDVGGNSLNHQSSIINYQFKRAAAITVGRQGTLPAVDEHFHFPCDLPASPLRLWEHLAIKLVLNTISTATMVRMGRVVGNAMVWASPSNKKLIDRGTRLIALSTGYSYERACEALFEAIEEVARRSQSGEEVPSPVALAIERIQAAGKEEPA
jgi:N-acetylmuramic acid 6-phosphate etherase